MNTDIHITKASGEKELFSREKLKHSLEKSGATDAMIRSVTQSVEKMLYDGISTKEIYRKAFASLKKQPHTAARYNLKRAIMSLGPTGFPFEKYIAEIMKAQGYSVAVSQIIKGHCVKHEIDIIAEKGDQHFLIECKFHLLQGTICTLKTTLYVHSRFLDVVQEWKLLPGHAHKYHQAWLVTNTRFSTDAIQYGTCAGIHLLGWNYPVKGSLRELIDITGLHPITSLTSLSNYEKGKLLEENIILCKEIGNYEKLLKDIGVKAERLDKVLDEAANLCGNA